MNRTKSGLPAEIVIIGAGPAGLTAAMELVRAGRKDIVVLEATGAIGGLSQTVNYKGNRIDIGGHRFFSKSDWVMQWWQSVLPVAAGEASAADVAALRISYQGKSRPLGPAKIGTETDDDVMLVRPRLSRILFSGAFFDYPLKPGLDFVVKLGLLRCVGFGLSYVWAHLFPRRPEVTLEDFFINRFGHKLYRQFFKEYTEKVWGRPCTAISAEWGAQRIKSLSIGKALWHGLRKRFAPDRVDGAQMTSLIERFLYPKFGPGQVWERVADMLRAEGVRVVMQAKVNGIELSESRVEAVSYADAHGRAVRLPAGHVVSTMPVRELVAAMGDAPPRVVREVAQGLEYRDFITVGLLYRELTRGAATAAGPRSVPDNWIYVQEPGVQVGRLQIFNNWSPHMVADPETVWVGMEFFCQEGDALWSMSDAELLALGKREMRELGLGEQEAAIDGVVIRMPKAYPGYYGSYERFDTIRSFLDTVPNLYLVGRNGMHRYNNQDHSMLSAKAAVECILTGSSDKSQIWAINVDDDYHEELDQKSLEQGCSGTADQART